AVSFVRDHREARHPGGESSQHVGALVARSVVDDDDLVVVRQQLELTFGFDDQIPDRLTVVVAGKKDRDGWPGQRLILLREWGSGIRGPESGIKNDRVP